MEEIREVGPLSLQKNFRVEKLFSARNILVISRCRKRLIMPTPKRENFIQLFQIFSGMPV